MTEDKKSIFENRELCLNPQFCLYQVNKALPRVEQELEDLIADWERLHQVS